VKAASPRGLPVIWVQDRMLTAADLGRHPRDELRAAVRAAEEHREGR
jgi:hypothetical protein